MTTRDRIQSGKRPGPRRAMLYGTHGIGKSTFGACSDRPIFVPTEDGLGEIECDRFPLAQSFDEVITALGERYSQEHSYRTVVIDSLDWLERLIWADVCQKRSVENIEDNDSVELHNLPIPPSPPRRFLPQERSVHGCQVTTQREAR